VIDNLLSSDVLFVFVFIIECSLALLTYSNLTVNYQDKKTESLQTVRKDSFGQKNKLRGKEDQETILFVDFLCQRDADSDERAV